MSTGSLPYPEPQITGTFLGTNTTLPEAPQSLHEEFTPRPVPSMFTIFEEFAALPSDSNDIASDQVVTEADTPGAVVLARLKALLRQEDSDEFGVLKPTDYAFDLATGLVQEASTLGPTMPKGSVATDSQGGVRITWFREDREVELVCPAGPDSSPYIYHEAGSDYALHEDASGRALASWLRWLVASS